MLDGRLAAGNDTYRAYRFAWNGMPDARAQGRPAREELRVSWNGATQVAAWEVDGRAIPSTGFETGIPAPNRTTVRALDANGAVLGESPTR